MHYNIMNYLFRTIVSIFLLFGNHRSVQYDEIGVATCTMLLCTVLKWFIVKTATNQNVDISFVQQTKPR